MKAILTILFALFIFLTKTVIAQPVLSLTAVITGLNSPMQLVNAGDGSKRIFIVQKGGTILLYDKNYIRIDTFLTVTGISSSGERGLLSMAFHPDYVNNGFFYVYYTNSSGNLELSRYRVSANANVANVASKVILKTIPHPVNANHNGGTLHFGIDGYLYLSTGDGGGGGDVPNNAQNHNVLLGKMLRFAVDTSDVSPYYSIPSGPTGNPFGNEVYDYGLRNPFRWNFDRLTHDMWIGDVGQDAWEEIDFRPADSTRKVNFGWHCYEGYATYSSVGTDSCTGIIADYTFPIFTYRTTEAPSIAVTGGCVYRGTTFPFLEGYYISADYFTDTFYIIRRDTINHVWITVTQSVPPAGMSDFGETEDGELYAVCLNANTVYRILSNGPVVYRFTGNGNWTDATNWSNKTIPPSSLPSGSEIIIDPLIDGECILNIPQTILTGAKITVEPNKNFRINGNLVVQ